MKNRILITFLFLPNLLLCCSCAFFTSFCENISSNSDVALVEILKTYDAQPVGLVAEVQVVETLQGTATKIDWTIIVSSGTSCDPDNSVFQVGDSMVVELRNEQVNFFTNPHDYYFENGCRDDFLLLKNNRVETPFSFGNGSKTLEQFKSELPDCAKLSYLENTETLAQLTTVFPTLTDEVLNIDISTASQFRYQIFNAAGQLIIEGKVESGRTQVGTAFLPKGAYFVKVKVNETFVLKRFVKI